MNDKFDYVSNDDSLLCIQRYCLQEGKAAGTQMIRVSNATGLELHIAVDRSLDMAELRFRGVSLGYLSATGITHPSYYEPEGYGWLRSFYGGFMATCGLDQVGEPCQVNGSHYGLHGRISNCPAEQICTEVRRGGRKLEGIVSGVIRQACQQGEAYLLRRTYHFSDDSAAFTFTDEIENLSGKAVPLQLLYHFNLGYPFLSPSLQMELPPAKTEGWDEVSESKCDQYMDCTDPEELTLLHHLKEPQKPTQLILKNQGIRLCLGFDGEKLPILAQWRLLQPREYVLAFEPTNNHLRGLAWEKEYGQVEMLQPGEKRVYHFCIICQEERS